MLTCYQASVAEGEENRLFTGDQELGCVNEECYHLLASLNMEEERRGVCVYVCLLEAIVPERIAAGIF